MKKISGLLLICVLWAATAQAMSYDAHSARTQKYFADKLSPETMLKFSDVALAEAQQAVPINHGSESVYISQREAPAASGRGDETTTAISPIDLWQAFDNNEVAAEDQYKDKIVTLIGTIESITTGPTGAGRVNFRVDKHGFNNVVCEFVKDKRPELAKLKKGQQVMISGTCRGMSSKDVYLKDCSLLN